LTVVLDTHAWLWLRSDPDRLSPTARQAIEDADRLGICAISCWEVATLARRGRIALDRDVEAWIGQALAGQRVESVPLTAEIATTAGLLDERFPGDPADRIIYATARASSAPLITRDRALRSFDPQRTIW
jgi:PIN domain nuclease of toxin-antitoxin system